MFFISSKKVITQTTLFYYTIEAKKSILKQSQFNEKRLQKDGWGIGYFEDSNPYIHKSSNSIYSEKDKLKDKIKKIKTTSFIMHIRRASNPRNLEIKKLISEENTQPYCANNIIFTHNGTLNIVDEIYENLAKYKKFVKGLNDSEVLFWHIMKNLDAYGDIPQAIKAARREINTVWISVKNNYKHFKEPYIGLNIFIYTEKNFYALCDFRLKKETYSIMTPSWEYGRYAIKKEKDIFIISSEPLDNERWQKINHNSLIEFDIKAFKLKISDAGGTI
ncbi:MAG: class II glutamine amidotransferase [Elusimicrobiales bacterium]